MASLEGWGPTIELHPQISCDKHELSVNQALCYTATGIGIAHL